MSGIDPKTVMNCITLRLGVFAARMAFTDRLQGFGVRLFVVAVCLLAAGTIGTGAAYAQNSATVSVDHIIAGTSDPSQTITATYHCGTSWNELFGCDIGVRGLFCTDGLVNGSCSFHVDPGTSGTVVLTAPYPVSTGPVYGIETDFYIDACNVFCGNVLVPIYLYQNPITVVSASPTQLVPNVDSPIVTATFQYPNLSDHSLCLQYTYTDYILGARSVFTSACGTVPAGSTSITFTGVPTGPPPYAEPDAGDYLQVGTPPEPGYDGSSVTGNIQMYSSLFPITIVPQKDPGPCLECEGQGGHPINLPTGDTWITKKDYSVPGLAGGLSVSRTWNSLWNHTAPIFGAGMFGLGWTSDVEERLQVLDSTRVKYWRGSGNTWILENPDNCGTPCTLFIVTSPPREFAVLNFNASTQLYTLTLKDGTRKIFNGNGYLTTLVDRNGNQTTITYTSGIVTQITAPGGQRLSFAHANSLYPNLVTSASDTVGTVATYTYSGNLLSRVTYADGAQENYAYDAGNHVTAVTDELGKVLETHTYDSDGRGLTSSRANGVDAIVVEYPSAGTTIVHDSLGNSTTYTATVVNGGSYLTGIQGPGCDSCGGRNNQSFTLDGIGRRQSTMDPNGGSISFTYDSKGNVLTKTDAAGTWTYTYNVFNEIVTAQDPLNHTTTNTYDQNGNLLSITTPSPDGGTTPGSTTSFTYDATGQLTQITDPRGNATTLTYYTTGLIKTIKDAGRNTTTFTYDNRGNLLTVKNALNQTTTYTYDSRNRLTRITYPNSAITQFSYDTRSRRTSVTDPNNKATAYAYDDADRLTSVTDASNQITGYGYDTENNLTSVTDPLNRTTGFEYDALGRVTKTTFPSLLFETYGYDTAGNLTSKIDRKGIPITYSYDGVNRLTGKYYPDASSVTYGYDAASRLTQIVDPTGTYQFTYDNMDRLKQTNTTYSFLPSRTFTTVQGYDAASNRAALTDPENGQTTYVYNTLNQLTTLTNFQNQAFNFGYDAIGGRTSLSRPNNVTSTYTYNTVSQLLSVVHKKQNTTLDGATYTVDAANNRTSRTALPGNVASNFGYDNTYQLLSATQGSTTAESYTYDAVGNRLSSLGVSPYTYNPSNQLTAKPGVTYTYDNNGNMLTKTDGSGTTSYTWDYDNRLSSVTLPGSSGTVTFKYDPFGRRIYKAATGTTIFVYDGESLLEEVDGSGTVVARYTQSQNIDEPLAMLRAGTTSYYEADGLGSVTSLTNSSGTVSATYTYGTFGNQAASTGSVTNSFRYTGRESDSETGLMYYRARYYDPSAGRFLSEDPTGFKGGVDFYLYATNDPTNQTDPMGFDSDSQFCRRLREKINNVRQNIQRRIGQLDENPDNLPETCPGDKAKPSLSKAGHRMLINKDKALLAALEATYAWRCKDWPPVAPIPIPVLTPQQQQQVIKNTATVVVIGVGLVVVVALSPVGL